MTKRSVIFICLIVSFTAFYSCKEDQVLQPGTTTTTRFFPLKKGHWIEYVADSVVHLDDDDANNTDTSIDSYHFFVREEIDSSYIDAVNEPASVVLRYRRTTDTVPWLLTNVWTAKLTAHSAERTEDNIHFVKLSLPVSDDSRWNGNAFNFFPPEEYSYEDLYTSVNYDSLSFDSTISVLQNDFVSNINRIYKKEIYAAGAGLIEKEIDSVNTLNTDSGTIILTGLEYHLQVTGYSH